jgi:hypothetical protein
MWSIVRKFMRVAVLPWKGKRSSSGARKVVESNLELNHGVAGRSFLNEDVRSSRDPNSGNYIAASLHLVCLSHFIFQSFICASTCTSLVVLVCGCRDCFNISQQASQEHVHHVQYKSEGFWWLFTFIGLC